MEQYDTLLHLSSETETAFRSINNFLIYFLLWNRDGSGGGGGQTQPSFLSMNQLATSNVYDTGIAKYAVQNIAHPHSPEDFSNYRDQYLQGYWEVKSDGDYSGVSLKTAYPISRTVKLEGRNSNWCYLTKYKRYLDSKEFYFIQMSQRFNGYLNPSSYKALSELLQYIKEKYPGLYVITGDFNVQGHEKVFEHYLGSRDYHICPFYKTVTCNDNEGMASPDGLVVSRELYPRVEYAVDLYTGYSYQHFIVSAKLYPKSRSSATYDITSASFKEFLNILKLKNGHRDNFIGNAGIFDGNNSEMTGTPENIREVSISTRGPKTFTAVQLTEVVK